MTKARYRNNRSASNVMSHICEGTPKCATNIDEEEKYDMQAEGRNIFSAMRATLMARWPSLHDIEQGLRQAHTEV
jgi:hypothetical protein